MIYKDKLPGEHFDNIPSLGKTAATTLQSFSNHIKKFSAPFKRVLGLFFPLLLSMPGYQSLKRIIVSTALLWEISARCGLIVRCAATRKLLQGKEQRLCSHLNHSTVGRPAGFVTCNGCSTLPVRV